MCLFVVVVVVVVVVIVIIVAVLSTSAVDVDSRFNVPFEVAPVTAEDLDRNFQSFQTSRNNFRSKSE